MGQRLPENKEQISRECRDIVMLLPTIALEKTSQKHQHIPAATQRTGKPEACLNPHFDSQKFRKLRMDGRFAMDLNELDQDIFIRLSAQGVLRARYWILPCKPAVLEMDGRFAMDLNELDQDIFIRLSAQGVLRARYWILPCKPAVLE
ncbi:hypothetical protein HGM15179_003490 [Zosterops borbonicus]|uniref:Uncharacterized protein n=1 Tax=Zosterops borbonicus TaxID=364589 RepID=A0A8K1GSM6_9PASS|nr:hypothetical protein HGM15179_003490 [Zosterops borbonicus]